MGKNFSNDKLIQNKLLVVTLCRKCIRDLLRAQQHREYCKERIKEKRADFKKLKNEVHVILVRNESITGLNEMEYKLNKLSYEYDRETFGMKHEG